MLPPDMRYPPSDIQVDEALVRELLEVEHPELATGSVRLIGEGWDNYSFLLGDSLALRIPRRTAAVALLLKEQRWLPLVAPRLPLLVPLPVHSAPPTERFPWAWSIVRWIPGATAEKHSFGFEDAHRLADTLRALHQPAPAGAPANPYRGVPLLQRSERMRELLRLHEGNAPVDLRAVVTLWQHASAAREDAGRRWLHGDLHPGNVLIRDSSLIGIIDWGDLCAGDVATDLAAAWLLLDDDAVRADFLDRYGAPPALQARAMGWALLLGLSLAASAEHWHVTIGWTVVRRVLADPRAT